jgi:hypothetical protein
MTRTLLLPVVLVSLAIGGFLFARQAQSNGPTAPAVTQAESQAAAATAATNFSGALPVLQAWFADHGTYAGVSLPPAFGVAVVRADATSYCLQAGTSHLAGPGGVAQPGPC